MIILHYLFALLTSFVQFLTQWAWKEEATFLRTFLKIKKLNQRPDGTVNSELVMTKDDALVLCHALVCIFNNETNFTEIVFQTKPEYTKGYQKDESLVVHIFREKGITPAVLLAAARHERDELQK